MSSVEPVGDQPKPHRLEVDTIKQNQHGGSLGRQLASHDILKIEDSASQPRPDVPHSVADAILQEKSISQPVHIVAQHTTDELTPEKTRASIEDSKPFRPKSLRPISTWATFTGDAVSRSRASLSTSYASNSSVDVETGVTVVEVYDINHSGAYGRLTLVAGGVELMYPVMYTSYYSHCFPMDELFTKAQFAKSEGYQEFTSQKVFGRMWEPDGNRRTTFYFVRGTWIPPLPVVAGLIWISRNKTGRPIPGGNRVVTGW